MMIRYISCPLEAALAAKNFGMMFISPEGNNLFTTFADGEMAWYEEFITANRIFIERYLYNKFLILPQNLGLIEPKVGDGVAGLGCDEKWHFGNVIRLEEASEFYDVSHAIVLWSGSNDEDILNLDEFHHDRICERDGKPFPKIEWGESEC